MRCVHCAAEVSSSSIFCGVCGRKASGTASENASETGASGAAVDGLEGGSLFELPVSSSARAARIAVVLLIDAVLVGAGLVMGWSWWSSRSAAAAPAPPVVARTPAPADAAREPVAEVELPPPRVIDHGSKPGAPTRPSRPGTPGPSRPPTAPVAPGPTTTPPAPPAPPPTEPSPTPVPVLPPPAADAAEATPAAADAASVIPDPGTDTFEGGVREVVRTNMVHVKRCYTHAAKAASTSTEPLEGKVEVQFTITRNGDAADVRVVENTTKSDPLADCLSALVATWSFPHPEEDVEFVWPFVFKAPR